SARIRGPAFSLSPPNRRCATPLRRSLPGQTGWRLPPSRLPSGRGPPVVRADAEARLLFEQLSFAQFEREIIAERTRDNMAATGRKGKWSGTTPVLVYDLDPRGRRLHVNDEEATRVRVIFALSLDHQALLPVVQELARRGWVGKCWQTRDGRPFDKTSLYRL